MASDESKTLQSGRNDQLISVPWGDRVPDHDWEIYRRVLEKARQEGIRLALGGGFAFSAYSGRWRDTKDLDLYILPRDREVMVEILSTTDFEDYFAKNPYDRGWIYRGYRDGVIADLIWAMANQRAQVDHVWLERARIASIRGTELRVLAPEELVWTKLYVIQRERSDWPDLLSILYAQGHHLDWEYLLSRVGEDKRLLGGLLSVFTWMCPGQAVQLPGWIWARVGLTEPEPVPSCRQDRHRVALLDRRDWFGPLSESALAIEQESK